MAVKKIKVEVEPIEETTRPILIEEDFGRADLNKLRDAINTLAEAVWR